MSNYWGNDRISDDFPWGEHIALKCKDHPDKRWSTKNIGYIGARSLFYNLFNIPDMGPECSCSIKLLVPLTLEESLADIEAGRDSNG